MPNFLNIIWRCLYTLFLILDKKDIKFSLKEELPQEKKLMQKKGCKTLNPVKNTYKEWKRDKGDNSSSGSTYHVLLESNSLEYILGS